MKTKTVYVCTECGAKFPKWMGKCTTCNSWNTIEEEIIRETKAEGRRRSYIITEKGQQMLDNEYQRLQAQTADYDRIRRKGAQS